MQELVGEIKNFINQHVHCLVASSASTVTAAATLTTLQDILLRGAASIVVGVVTWCITQLLSKRINKK